MLSVCPWAYFWDCFLSCNSNPWIIIFVLTTSKGSLGVQTKPSISWNFENYKILHKVSFISLKLLQIPRQEHVGRNYFALPQGDRARAFISDSLVVYGVAWWGKLFGVFKIFFLNLQKARWCKNTTQIGLKINCHEAPKITTLTLQRKWSFFANDSLCARSIRMPTAEWRNELVELVV